MKVPRNSHHWCWLFSSHQYKEPSHLYLLMTQHRGSGHPLNLSIPSHKTAQGGLYPDPTNQSSTDWHPLIENSWLWCGLIGMSFPRSVWYRIQSWTWLDLYESPLLPEKSCPLMSTHTPQDQTPQGHYAIWGQSPHQTQEQVGPPQQNPEWSASDRLFHPSVPSPDEWECTECMLTFSSVNFAFHIVLQSSVKRLSNNISFVHICMHCVWGVCVCVYCV